MRAFVGQLDRFTLWVLLGGLALGALWLISLRLGIIASGFVVIVAPILFVTRHRWLEIGLLLVATGLVPSVSYQLFGGPPARPLLDDGTTIPVENYAHASAYVLVFLGTVVLLVTVVLDLLAARRRERLGRLHDARKRTRLEDRPAS